MINWNEKKNVIFQTNHGYINELEFYNTSTCCNMKAKYFLEIGHYHLYHKDKIQFIYNGQQIIFKDNITVGQYFLNESNVTIFVSDLYNLFSINWEQSKNISFIFNNDFKDIIAFNNKDTTGNLLKKYLCKIEHKELTKLMGNNDISLFYNSQQIQSEDKTTIGEFFLNNNNPIISVVDNKNLISLIHVTFKTTQGNVLKFHINPKKSIDLLLTKYLCEIDKPEFIGKSDKIVFLYKARSIKFGDKTMVRNYFDNDYKPVILVMDTDNLLSYEEFKKKNIIFESDSGQKNNITVSFGTTVEQSIKKYLYRIGGIELIEYCYCENKERISFTASSNNINFEQSLVEKYFNSYYGTVKVFGVNNF